jgi:hypothetical protein
MNVNTPDDHDVFTPILATAERVLSQAYGSQIRLGDVTRLTRKGRRNVILRCQRHPEVVGRADGVPAAHFGGAFV